MEVKTEKLCRTIVAILETYQDRFAVLPPTGGTVLDMGRKLTHKRGGRHAGPFHAPEMHPITSTTTPLVNEQLGKRSRDPGTMKNHVVNCSAKVEDYFGSLANPHSMLG
ncbi:MAG: hypothetical protein AB1446_07240 [Bacillota bacterium]